MMSVNALQTLGSVETACKLKLMSPILLQSIASVILMKYTDGHGQLVDCACTSIQHCTLPFPICSKKNSNGCYKTRQVLSQYAT